MLHDGLDSTLKEWLDGTNWPEGFHYTQTPVMVSNYLAQKLRVWKGIDSIELFLNANKLTKSDFEFVISSVIRNIEGSSAISQRYNHGKAAIKK